MNSADASSPSASPPIDRFLQQVRELTGIPQGLSPSDASRALRVLLVTLDSPNEALIFLTGTDAIYKLCLAAAKPNKGVVELHLQAQGFSIDDGTGRRDIASVDAMVAALAASGQTTNDGEPRSRPFIAAFPAPPSRQGLHIVIPPGRLEDAMSALDHMETEDGASIDFLLVAGNANAVPTPSQRTALAELTAVIPGLQCLAFGTQETNVAWANEVRAALKLAVISLPSGDAVSSVPILAADKPAARRLAGDYSRLLAASDSLDATAESQLAEAAKLNGELKSLVAKPPPRPAQEMATEIREASEATVQFINEEINLLVRHRDESTRDTLLPQGSYYDLVRRFGEGLKDTDLDYQDDHKNTRIKPREASIKEIQSTALRRVFNDLESEAALVNEALEATAEEAASRLARTLGTTEPLRVPRYEIGRLLDFAGTVLTPPIMFKGELPRMPAGRFLWETVQHPVMIIFTLMMPASLFMSSQKVAGALRDFRFDVALFGLLPLYIITPFFLWKRFTREKNTALEKEMDRYRQTVQGETDRGIRMALEEKKRVLGEFLRTTLDDLRKQVTERAKRATLERERKNATEVAETKAAMQRANARLQELAAASTRCEQLRKEAETLRRTLENAWNPLG